jgi:hypothetical protein
VLYGDVNYSKTENDQDTKDRIIHRDADTAARKQNGMATAFAYRAISAVEFKGELAQTHSY